MKVEWKDCGHVGEAVIPPPKGSRLGEKSQKIPACAKCRSGNIIRLIG